MNTPKRRRRGPATPVDYTTLPEGLIDPSCELWKPLEAFPGYLISADGRVARQVKVRTNKNGTRYVRVSIKGVQSVILL